MSNCFPSPLYKFRRMLQTTRWVSVLIAAISEEAQRSEAIGKSNKLLDVL